MDVTPPTLVHRLAGEALGTTVIVAAAGATAIGDLGVDAQAAGFALVAAMYAFGRLSGGHFNPAVSIGSALSGRTSWAVAGPYVGAQFAGGLVAGLLLLVFGLGGESFEAFDTPLGANGWGDDGTGYALWAAVLMTLVVTALFVLVWLGLTDERNEHAAFAPLGAGLALVAALSITYLSTGGTVNPAQSFGLAVFSGGDPIIQVWVFLIGTLLGGAAAGFLYPALFGADREAVPGSGLNFSSKPSGRGVYAAPGGYQQWNQPGGQHQAGYDQAGQQQGGYEQGGYEQGGFQQQGASSYAGAQQSAEQPIIQDGWQWDPQSQQWIPAQQQPPAQGGGWAAPAAGEQTQVRPNDG